MNTATINLEDFRSKGSKVFTGRAKGLEVRENSLIDSLIKDNTTISIIVPEDIYSINPSFLEEFLINIVSELGASGFAKKIQFTNLGEYKIDKDLEEAIERILRTENALV